MCNRIVRAALFSLFQLISDYCLPDSLLSASITHRHFTTEHRFAGCLMNLVLQLFSKEPLVVTDQAALI